MVLDVPLEEDLVELVARGGYVLPVESVDAVFEKYEFRALRRRLREVAGGDASARPAGAQAGAAAGAQTGSGAAAGSGVRLAHEPDVGPLAAAL